jgi:hypothetical protein
MTRRRRRPRFYRLNPDHSVTPLDDGGPIDEQVLRAWAAEWGSTDRRVAFDVVAPGIEVSTVFLGVDHNYFGGPPLLFETMVFDDYGGGDCRRWPTWAGAVNGHRQLVVELTKRTVSQWAGARPGGAETKKGATIEAKETDPKTESRTRRAGRPARRPD